VLLKRRAPTRRGGDYCGESQVIQKDSRPSPSNCDPICVKILPEEGSVFRKADVVGCRVIASHFPSDKVQYETKIKGSTPVAAKNWGKNTTVVAILTEFAR